MLKSHQRGDLTPAETKVGYPPFAKVLYVFAVKSFPSPRRIASILNFLCEKVSGVRPFTKEPKKNHIQGRECNTESYQRSKPSLLSNKRQPLLLLWTFESLTHSHLSSQELFYCIYQYTTTIKINVKRENR